MSVNLVLKIEEAEDVSYFILSSKVEEVGKVSYRYPDSVENNFESY